MDMGNFYLADHQVAPARAVSMRALTIQEWTLDSSADELAMTQTFPTATVPKTDSQWPNRLQAATAADSSLVQWASTLVWARCCRMRRDKLSLSALVIGAIKIIDEDMSIR